MSALIITVLIASLLGSLHCAGMCGAFVAFAVGAGDGGEAPGRWRLQAAYHGGRLATYTLLGVICGAMGAMIDWGGSMVGLSRAAAVGAGVVMILFGLTALLRLWGARLPHVRPPAWLQRLIGAGQRRAMRLGPTPRALVIGLLTTLLPCGWLYAFAVTAAGTASPLWGGLTMAAFWAGTLPVLVALGFGVQKASGFLGARLPTLTAIALVIVGLLTVTARLQVDASAFAGSAASTPPSTTQEAIERVEQLDASDMACCPFNASDP